MCHLLIGFSVRIWVAFSKEMVSFAVGVHGVIESKRPVPMSGKTERQREQQEGQNS